MCRKNRNVLGNEERLTKFFKLRKSDVCRSATERQKKQKKQSYPLINLLVL